MNFQIAGKRYEVTREDVMDATRDIPPTIPDARHKYFVKLHNRHYPIKQVIQLVTGLPLPEFIPPSTLTEFSPPWVSTFPTNYRLRWCPTARPTAKVEP